MRRLLNRWLRNKHVANVDFDLVESCLRLVPQDARVAKVNLPRDRHLRRRQGTLFIEGG